MASKKRKTKFSAAKEARRRARLATGTPPTERVIPDKRRKPAKHKKALEDFTEIWVQSLQVLKETEEAASQLSTDRSKLIRSAVESYLEGPKRTELEEALAEGYRTHPELDRQIAEEFAPLDNENL